MHTLKIIATVFDVLFIIIIFYFQRALRWNRKDDRASIIGFWTMIELYILNVVCIWQ